MRAAQQQSLGGCRGGPTKADGTQGAFPAVTASGVQGPLVKVEISEAFEGTGGWNSVEH